MTPNQPSALAAEWQDKRGTFYGCDMATIALGDGVINLPPVVKALQAVGFDGATTLEVAGPENVKRSMAQLKEWSES